VWRLGRADGAITVEVELPDVAKASEIDAYAENGVLGVEVEGRYSLRVPLHEDSIVEDQLSCRWKKKEKKLIVTVSVEAQAKEIPAKKATPAKPAAPVQVPQPAPEPAEPAKDPVRTPDAVNTSKEETETVSNATSEPAAVPTPALQDMSLSDGELELTGEEFTAEKVELEKQEGLEALLADKTEKVSEAKIVNGVSDFSIFRHDLGKEFDAIYAATRANLPTIAADDDDDDDEEEEIEVLDATGKLEALKQRTYDTLEAKGLQFTPAPQVDS